MARKIEPWEVVKRLEDGKAEAVTKAWDALSRYKFLMFGYWAAIWVHLNHISGGGPSPFSDAVKLAREKVAVKIARGGGAKS